jgi:hypothetical protein
MVAILATIVNGASPTENFMMDVIIEVTKATQAAPAAPTMASNTSSSITLNTITNGEYSMNGGAWQTSATFSGLTASTSYNFVQRYAETATHFASAASAPATYSTLPDGGGTTVTQTIELVAGNNWISVNVLSTSPSILDQMKSSLSTVGISIIGSSGSTVRLTPTMWTAGLSAISEREMYQIDVTANYTMTLTGIQADPATTPITIKPGLNWIGYIPTFEAGLEDALSGITANANDQLKQKSSYATFFYGMWYGVLQKMQPDNGYIYYSLDETTKTFYYPSTESKNAIIKYQPQFELKHQPNVHRYSGNMTVTAVVVKNDKEMRGDHIEIQAFSGSECRGSVQLMYIDVLDKYIGFLMVHGEGNEMITLKAYDHITGKEYRTENAPFRYVTDEIVGNLDKPYIVDLGAEMSVGIDELTIDNGQLTIYPNPTRGELVVSSEYRVVSIEVFDVYGRAITTQYSILNTQYSIDISHLPVGVYFLKIQTENGVVMKKVVKE